MKKALDLVEKWFEDFRKERGLKDTDYISNSALLIWLAEKQLNDHATAKLNRPEWLTPAVIEQAKSIWKKHTTAIPTRVEAIKYIIEVAKKAGYEIGPKKSKEIFDEFCQ